MKNHFWDGGKFKKNLSSYLVKAPCRRLMTKRLWVRILTVPFTWIKAWKLKVGQKFFFLKNSNFPLKSNYKTLFFGSRVYILSTTPPKLKFTRITILFKSDICLVVILLKLISLVQRKKVNSVLLTSFDVATVLEVREKIHLTLRRKNF